VKRRNRYLPFVTEWSLGLTGKFDINFVSSIVSIKLRVGDICYMFPVSREAEDFCMYRLGHFRDASPR